MGEVISASSVVGDFIRARGAFLRILIGTTSSTAIERLRIMANGFIGIGTTNPTANIHIVSTDATGATVKLASRSALGVLQLTDGVDSTNLSISSTGSSQSIGSNLTFNTRKLGATYQRMIIDEDGDVGIGTTGPVKTLDVNGAIQANEICLPDGMDPASKKCFQYACPGVNGQWTLSQTTCVSATAPMLSFATDTDSPGARYMVMGSRDQILYRFRLTAGATEGVRVTSLTFTDTIANNTAGSQSLFNFRLYDESDALLAVPVNMVLNGATPGLITFSLGTASSIVIPRGGFKTVTVRGDIAQFAKSGSSHTLSLAFNGDVVALGESSSLSATNVGLPISGTSQTVYHTQLSLTSSVLGATTGRVRNATDTIASMVWSANAARDLTVNTVKIKFSGQVVTSGTTPFAVSLIDTTTNALWNSSVVQTCRPTTGSQCSVTFTPQASISSGSGKTVNLRVDSRAFFNSPNTGDSLSAAIVASTDIIWSDGATNNIGFESARMPITLTNASYQ